MTKDEFKTKWESDDDGGGITFDDVAAHAQEWGLYTKPRIHPIHEVLYAALKAAGTNDAEEYSERN